MIIDVLKSAYQVYKEKQRQPTNMPPGTVWIDTSDNTIHIEGGGMTVTELYNEIKQQLELSE